MKIILVVYVLKKEKKVGKFKCEIFAHNFYKQLWQFLWYFLAVCLWICRNVKLCLLLIKDSSGMFHFT